jgi:hypothetical protein
MSKKQPNPTVESGSSKAALLNCRSPLRCAKQGVRLKGEILKNKKEGESNEQNEMDDGGCNHDYTILRRLFSSYTFYRTTYCNNSRKNWLPSR